MSAVLDLPACIGAVYREGHICVRYADGMEVRFPVAANRRLRGHAEAKLNHIEIGYFGLHWLELDEDLSPVGLRAGRFGQP